MLAIFLASCQPADVIDNWAATLQSTGSNVKHVATWSGPGELCKRQPGCASNVDSFLLGPGTSFEGHIAQHFGGDGIVLVSLERNLQQLPRSGAVLLVWQPQVPQDIVQACMALPPSLVDLGGIRSLLLVDASPSLTLSVTHKALEGAGYHALARKPTVVLPRNSASPQTVLQALLQLAEPLPSVPAPQPSPALSATAVRIAVARDDAFGPCFYENFLMLQQTGAQLLFFSPLYDACIPSGVACLYLSSGPIEPERWQQLANNRPLLASVRAFCDAGGMVLAEGAGLLYLSRSVDLDDDEGASRHRVHDMAGVLPFKTRLLSEAQTAAVQVHVTAGNPLLPQGSRSRGYLSVQASLVLLEERQLQGLVLGGSGKAAPGPCKNASSQYSTTYEVTVVDNSGASSDRNGLAQSHVEEGGDVSAAPQPEGYVVDNVLASSCLLYLPSQPGLAAHLVRRCACIDVVALAAGMAQFHAFSNGPCKLHHPVTAGLVGSRTASRRQSIQDMPAWGAAFGSNSGNTCAASAAIPSMVECGTLAAAHPQHPYTVQSLCTVPLRGDAGAVTHTGCLSSPRQSGHFRHSASTSALGYDQSGVQRHSLCGPGGVGCESGCLGEGSQSSLKHQAVQSVCSCGPYPGYAVGRSSHDMSSGVFPGLPRQQSLSKGACGSVPNGTSLPAPCVAASTILPVQRHKMETASKNCSAGEELSDASESIRLEQDDVAAAAERVEPQMKGDPNGICAATSMLGKDGAEARKDLTFMHHIPSTSSFLQDAPSSVCATILEPKHARQRSGMETVDLSVIAACGPASGWNGGVHMPGGQVWAPGMASAGGRHGSVSSLGPLGVPPGPGHGGVICCAPGACEALVAMGLANRIAGIGSDCDHPSDVCASRRVVLAWVPQDEAPQGAAARGIRVVPPCSNTSMGTSAGYISDACGGVARCDRASGDRGVTRTRRVLLLDELALRQEAPSVLVLPDIAELSEGERMQLEKALVEAGLLSPSGGPTSACTILHVSCSSLVNVMDLMLELGTVAGEPQASAMLLERLQSRLRRVVAAAGATSGAPKLGGMVPSLAQSGSGVSPTPAPMPRCPRVLVLQSLQPLVEAGRWIPEMLALAGASSCLAQAGSPDVQLTWQDIRERAAADVIIILIPPTDGAGRGHVAGSSGSAGSGGVCGQSGRACGWQEELAVLAAQPGWWCLPAVRVSRVYAVQSTYLTRPGPRLVDGVELLARLLMPTHFNSSRKVPGGVAMRLSLAAGQRCRATMLPSYFVPMVFS